MQQNKEIVQNFFRELEFTAESHQYTIGDRALSSVSSVVKRFTEPFDADRIAGFVARKRGITKEEVLAEWEAKKNAACDRGNQAHYFGEKVGLTYNTPDAHIATSAQEHAILKFWDNIPDHIEPFLFELQMFSEEFGIAGTADLLLYNTRTGKFIICDYKTNEDLFKNYKGKKLLAPFKDKLDMPFSKYEIQLSLYQILFEQCGFEVEDRKIIWLKPDGTYKSYKTENLTEKLLTELRK